MLPPAFDHRLGAIIGSKASEVGCVLLAIGCAADHVHVLVRLSPSVAPSDLVRRLKGATAHDINERRLMHGRVDWQSGYWAESVSPTDTTGLVRYFRAQRSHHDDSHPAEVWSAADRH